MSDWSSAQYLKFKAQRTQPAIDLAARIALEEPEEIIDIGCGPGNSTAVLRNRFSKAHIVGCDSSPDMIAAAKSAYPDLDFMLAEVPSGLNGPEGRFDVVFSNACIQWIPRHDELLPALMRLLKKDGVLAVQIPMNYDEPIHRIIGELAESGEWREKLGCPRVFHTLSQSEYFDLLGEISSDFEIWQTTYCHRMPSHDSIMEWYKGTGLRPYIDALGETDAQDFLCEVKERVRQEYPIQKNGEIIFRFPRFFFLARK